MTRIFCCLIVVSFCSCNMSKQEKVAETKTIHVNFEKIIKKWQVVNTSDCEIGLRTLDSLIRISPTSDLLTQYNHLQQRCKTELSVKYEFKLDSTVEIFSSQPTVQFWKMNNLGDSLQILDLKKRTHIVSIKILNISDTSLVLNDGDETFHLKALK